MFTTTVDNLWKQFRPDKMFCENACMCSLVSALKKALYMYSFSAPIRVGMILPARVNPPHKTRVYPGWAIWSYYPLWAICGFYEFLVWYILRFQSHGRYKSVEMNLYSHILISLNGKSEIVIIIGVSMIQHWHLNIYYMYLQDTDKSLIIIIQSIIMIMPMLSFPWKIS